MGLLGWVILGLAVGAIARALFGGRGEPGGCLGTLAIGVLGALIGGALASAAGVGELGSFFDLGTWLIAIAGASLLLLLLGAISGRRPV